MPPKSFLRSRIELLQSLKGAPVNGLADYQATLAYLERLERDNAELRGRLRARPKK